MITISVIQLLVRTDSSLLYEMNIAETFVSSVAMNDTFCQLSPSGLNFAYFANFELLSSIFSSVGAMLLKVPFVV